MKRFLCYAIVIGMIGNVLFEQAEGLVTNRNAKLTASINMALGE